MADGAVKSRITSLREFLAHNSRPVETSEMMAFWKACSEAERDEFCAVAIAAGF